MQQAKHVSTGRNTRSGKRNRNGIYLILLAVLVCVILVTTLSPRLVGGEATEAPAGDSGAVIPSDGASQDEADWVSPAVDDIPAVGTLLESGSDMNSNFYSKIDELGSIFNVTDSTFDFRPMAIDADMVAVRYDENTVVKTANLYYNSDTYEIYMGSLDDIHRLKDDVKYVFNIIFEDPGAAELRAEEIIISTFADLV